MEDDMADGSSPRREISPREEYMPSEGLYTNFSSSPMEEGMPNRIYVMDENSSSSGSSDGHFLHRSIKQTNLLESQIPTTGCSSLYLISNRLETVPNNKNSWTDTRRFMSFKDSYICCIPKRLVTNGTIRQTLKFISPYTLCNLRMKLQLMFKNRVIDEWQFEKGLVYRDVITRWETTINRSPNSKYFDSMLRACTLLKTALYDGDQLLHMYDMCIIFI